MIASDAVYLRAYYDSLFNRKSSDLAAEFAGFLYEKGDFYANLPDILEVDESWLADDARDIKTSLAQLDRRRNLPNFDQYAVSLLTTPVGYIEDMLGRLREYRTRAIR